MGERDLERIQRIAEEFAEQVSAQMGVRLEFDVPSLARLDAFLEEWIDMASVYDAPDANLAESLTVPVACYVGEVLVRVFAATWDDSVDDSGGVPALCLPTGQRVNLADAAAMVLRGLAQPAFHELARSVADSIPRDPFSEPAP